MRLVAGDVGLPGFDILIELGKVHRSVSDCATCIQPQPANGRERERQLAGCVTLLSLLYSIYVTSDSTVRA